MPIHREAVDLLAATAPSLAKAMAGIARLAYAILDSTLIPLTGSDTADRRYYAGKRRHNAVDAQVTADCAGSRRDRPTPTEDACPGAVWAGRLGRSRADRDGTGPRFAVQLAEQPINGQRPPAAPARSRPGSSS